MKKSSALLVLCLTFSNLFSQVKQIEIKTDPRVELITVMQLLYSYPLVGKADIKYKKEVLDYFGSHENDSTVLYFLDIAQKYFSFIKPINYTLHYSFPDFKQTAQFNDYEKSELEFGKYSDPLKFFIRNVEAFSNSARFQEFYESRKPFYSKIIADVKGAVDSADLVSILETHYGVKQKSYTLILSPLFIEAGMSTWIDTPSGRELYSIIGPNLSSRDYPDFDTQWMIRNLVTHEFSHPFCNPFIDANYKEMEKDSCLFEPVRKAMDQQGCGDWKSALKENFTRANEIVLIEKIYGTVEAEKLYSQYINQKWIFLKGLVPLVRKYSHNRNTYRTLNDLMPEVTDYFHAEAKNCNRNSN